MRAINLYGQLRHPVPPPPQEPPSPRNKCATGLYYSNILGADTVLESTPLPPLSSVLREIKVVGKPSLGLNAGLEALELPKHGKEAGIDHFHVSLAHAHASVRKATTKQHGIRLTGELVSCSACFRIKGNRVPTPHYATRRATQSLGLVYSDTAGPYPTCPRYVVMVVDSASRLQRPYGAREKSAAAIFLS